MRYALVTDGVVTNIISLHAQNASDFSNAVACDSAPVSIGDVYDGEAFYHNGQNVVPEKDQLQEEVNDLKIAMSLLGVTVDG